MIKFKFCVDANLMGTHKRTANLTHWRVSERSKSIRGFEQWGSLKNYYFLINSCLCDYFTPELKSGQNEDLLKLSSLHWGEQILGCSLPSSLCESLYSHFILYRCYHSYVSGESVILAFTSRQMHMQGVAWLTLQSAERRMPLSCTSKAVHIHNE